MATDETGTPRFVTAAVNGATLVLIDGEALDTANLPLASAFAVDAGGAAVAVASVAVSGTTVTLTLAAPVASGASVTVSDLDLNPVRDGATGVIPDAAGNDADLFFGRAVTNNTGAVTPPSDGGGGTPAPMPGPTFGTDGPDTLVGGAGPDTLQGGLGSDTLFGREGSDLRTRNQGVESLVGNRGNDTLYGGVDDDAVRGGKANDTDGIRSFVAARGGRANIPPRSTREGRLRRQPLGPSSAQPRGSLLRPLQVDARARPAQRPTARQRPHRHRACRRPYPARPAESPSPRPIRRRNGDL